MPCYQGGGCAFLRDAVVKGLSNQLLADDGSGRERLVGVKGQRGQETPNPLLCRYRSVVLQGLSEEFFAGKKKGW